MTKAELRALAEDIKANGLRHPIVRHRDGRIIDGRNRFLACGRAGVACPAVTYDQPDATIPAYVGSQNLHRRHLTPGQRAAIASELAELGHGGNRGNQYTGGKMSIDILGSMKKLGVRRPGPSLAATALPASG